MKEVNQTSSEEEELDQKSDQNTKETEKKTESKTVVKEFVEKKTDKKEDLGEIDLAQFTNLAVDPSVLTKMDVKKPSDKEPDMSIIKPVIKNSSEGSGVLKMIMIALLSFVVTVALGVGIGYAVLQLTNKQTPELNLSDEVTDVLEEPQVTPEPELVEINKEDYQLLVVNATTKAGYAGIVANDLEEAGFEDVVARNAKGEYEEGFYLLLSDLGEEQEASNQALLKEIQEITKADWQLSDKIEIEDVDASFGAVLVLAK